MHYNDLWMGKFLSFNEKSPSLPTHPYFALYSSIHICTLGQVDFGFLQIGLLCFVSKFVDKH